MSKASDIGVEARQPSSLNARSLALSVLLGTHPPRLPGKSLVALAELFGINAGTMRTALSRMAAAGDVTNDDGMYALTDRLRARQAAQDAGRARHARPWDGTWHTALAIADQRELADRRADRSVLHNARFGELRPDIWLRPANLPAAPLGDGWLVTTGVWSGGDPASLVDRLWPMQQIADTASTLCQELDATAASLDRADPTAIPPLFELSARIVRFLRDEPLLPPDLLPAVWPVPALRDRYDDVEQVLQSMMRPFLAGPGRPLPR